MLTPACCGAGAGGDAKAMPAAVLANDSANGCCGDEEPGASCCGSGGSASAAPVLATTGCGGAKPKPCCSSLNTCGDAKPAVLAAPSGACGGGCCEDTAAARAAGGDGGGGDCCDSDAAAAQSGACATSACGTGTPQAGDGCCSSGGGGCSNAKEEADTATLLGAGPGGLDADAIRAADVGVGIPVKTSVLTISGMTCSGCVSRIESHLRKNSAVVGVDVSLLTCKGRVQYIAGRGLDADAIATIVEQLGFEVTPELDSSTCTVDVAFAPRGGKPLSRAEAYSAIDAAATAARAFEGVTLVTVRSPAPKSPGLLPGLRLVYNPAATGARKLLASVQHAAPLLTVSPDATGARSATATVDAEFRRTLW